MSGQHFFHCCIFLIVPRYSTKGQSAQGLKPRQRLRDKQSRI